MVLPQMGLEVSEGTVTAVLVAVGDSVAEGQTVVEVETDKAIAEVAASRSGVVTSIVVEVGDTIPVGAPLIAIGDSVDESAPADSSADTTVLTNGNGARTADGSGRRRAAPIARRAAAEFGIALESIAGTGPGGRITLGDVERAAAERESAPPSPASVASSSGERLEPLSATRQAIARRLTESQLVPAYTLTRDIDATWLLAEKARLTAEGPAKVGVVDLLVQALAEALVRHPLVAASFVPAEGDAPAQFRHPAAIDVGLAVATDRGLLVPVLRRVNEKTLPELALERARLIEVTRAGRLGLDDMGGAATTLSSLGTFGVDSFTAMLNPGESSILAVGRTVEKVVPRDRGLAVVPTLTATFSFDHRVVDGATGAAGLAELADLLEGGMAWRT
ncbi:MAG TPA: dihydrolipoamide acetyltransferase family protein [Solirubrobacterales bacterium]|nr:dihydrolipoamide acetyltransferase family protein [Solirubrobacterales bacterium]